MFKQLEVFASFVLALLLLHFVLFSRVAFKYCFCWASPAQPWIHVCSACYLLMYECCVCLYLSCFNFFFMDTNLIKLPYLRIFVLDNQNWRGRNWIFPSSDLDLEKMIVKIWWWEVWRVEKMGPPYYFLVCLFILVWRNL